MSPTQHSAHRCHAEGCSTPVAPRFLMCRPHWAMVHPSIKRGIQRTYRAGQEVDKRPSAAYMVQHHRAVMWVALQEGLRTEEECKDHMARMRCLYAREAA